MFGEGGAGGEVGGIVKCLHEILVTGALVLLRREAATDNVDEVLEGLPIALLRLLDELEN